MGAVAGRSAGVPLAALTFAAGLAAAPFLATGLFRLSPVFVAWLPFAVLLAASAVLVLVRRARWAGLGLAVGTVAWAVLLAMLVADMGRVGS
ncbi:MAG: hypothetical protein QOF60_2060 [Actinomycetota bacterium]|nr:hypothetical protein [Actinomycetota bacterium]